MSNSVHFILYVNDQSRSAAFYAKVLDRAPRLGVPGMTEFDLPGGTILGLMPVSGIKRLLGASIAEPREIGRFPRCELYLMVDEPAIWHGRAISAGAEELAPLARRDWGHQAAYSLDADSHILAFASSLESPA